MSMKKLVLFFIIASTAMSFGLTIPSGVFRMNELGEAKAKAAEKQKPLCFIQSYASLKPS